MEKTIPELETILNSATKSFPNISSKKMFGCYALWVNDNVFGLVWKHGRIGVKLPNEKSYEALMSLKGAEPWKAGPMQMSHWVLVPESFHLKVADLKKWLVKAHEECSTLEKKPQKAAKTTKKVVKKVSKKK